MEGLKVGGFSAAETKKAGYTLLEAVSAGFATELKAGGYTIKEARLPTYHSMQFAQRASHAKKPRWQDSR